MKIDPYNNKEKYLEWKEKNKFRIEELSKKNSDLLLRYLNDMEMGLNVSKDSKKGSRSYSRLRTIRDRVKFLMINFEERFKIKHIIDIKDNQIHQFFNGMRTGQITRKDGGEYKSTSDYIKDFKAFWHWWMKIQNKEGVTVIDITSDLDTKKDKPKWVYLTEEQVRKLCNNAKYEYKILIMFIFDTGIRSPTELMNIKVSDLYNGYKELNIRDEISKTFGRRIKLMLCSELLKEYVSEKELSFDDYIFKIKPATVNKYLKSLATRVLGDKVSEAGKKYSEISLYDFRHCSCCYWLPRYKSESALKYRFGWKKSDKIHYYSELLGMKDTISEEDLLMDVTKTEIEKRLSKTETEKELLKERIDVMENQVKQLAEVIRKIYLEVN